MSEFDDVDETTEYYKSTPEKDSASPPVEIPAAALSADALNGVMENFINREGTDYGANEVGFDSKVDRVRKQLDRGDIKIIFDPDSESITLMTKNEWAKLKSKLGVSSPESAT